MKHHTTENPLVGDAGVSELQLWKRGQLEGHVL